jgi:hypothetical protein
VTFEFHIPLIEECYRGDSSIFFAAHFLRVISNASQAPQPEDRKDN